MRKTIIFTWLAAVAASGTLAAAQSFQTGDLYLVSSSLPGPGGIPQAGVCRIVPGTYAVTRLYTGPAAIFGRATFDAFRQRIILTTGAASFLQVGPDGSTSPLAISASGVLPTAVGDGRIYFVRGPTS